MSAEPVRPAKLEWIGSLRTAKELFADLSSTLDAIRPMSLRDLCQF